MESMRMIGLQKEPHAANTGLEKVAVHCSADPEVSGWLIKVRFYASTFVVKTATFAKPKNVSGHCKTTHRKRS
jgi:hypothetical protein